MNSRRVFSSGIIGAAAALVAGKAQAQVQEVVNVSSVVATGDVTIEQDAAGNITAEVGITRGPGGIQVVGNNGQVVSTGDVHLTQRASANMDVSTGAGGVCVPGEYQEFDGGLRFCDETGCWLEFRCGCRKGRC